MIILITEYIWSTSDNFYGEYIYDTFAIMKFSYNSQVPPHIYNEDRSIKFICIFSVTFYSIAFNDNIWGTYFST